MSKRDYRLLLEDILEAINKIKTYTKVRLFMLEGKLKRAAGLVALCVLCS